MKINNFSEFCDELHKCGFSMGGGSAKGIYAVIPYGWEGQDNIESPVKWHTGDRETDPWEWRMRVLEERDDVAYAKVFFRISGYITKEWYPYFYLLRRKCESLGKAYQDGTVSQAAKKIYDIIDDNGETALHDLKRLGCFGREDGAAFDKALVELQMRMYITMCGRTQKLNKYGEGYGWNSTVFTTSEAFWAKRGLDVASAAEDCTRDEAEEKIREQILKLNPGAEEKKIKRFIYG